MTALALCRGGWRAARAGASARARCSALAHAAPMHARAAGGSPPTPGRAWLAAAVAPSAVAAAPAWRCCRFRSLAASSVCAAAADDQLPATFVAPSKVNMDDYPPPKRQLNKDDVIVQFVRSGGAGGQNVNKVNTKADIRFDVLGCDFLPDWIKENLMQQEKNRMNNDGELVVNSSRHRTQKQNYEDALEKLQAMIDAAAKPPQGPSDETIKKVKTLAKKANQKRLEDKKRESSRKAERRSRDYD